MPLAIDFHYATHIIVDYAIIITLCHYIIIFINTHYFTPLLRLLAYALHDTHAILSFLRHIFITLVINITLSFIVFINTQMPLPLLH